MKKNILLLGNGGREHAIAKALKKSKKYDVNLFGFFNSLTPFSNLCENFYIEKNYNFGEKSGFKSLLEYVKNLNIDFAVIGPDDPIGAGVVDALLSIGIKSFAPTKENAKLESSKGFTRSLLEKYSIKGNPKFKNFNYNETNLEEIKNHISSLSYKFVIKNDGLCGGKGVFVQNDHFQSLNEAFEICKTIFEKKQSFLIEEKFEGVEFSAIYITDGKSLIKTPCITDHKRAFEGDKGPNTGGMGTISFAKGLPFITNENINEAYEISNKVIKALKSETEVDFCGVLYGGFIRTKNGVKLIEYNTRFGDPESLNILSLLESDAVELFEKTINQELNNLEIKFLEKSTVCKYIVPNGYPTSPKNNIPIKLNINELEGTEIYFASVYKERDTLLLGGSRAIGVVGIDEDYEKAKEKCEKVLDNIEGEVFYRKDIGSKELLQNKMDMVKNFK
jgi:phosphoribosylamine--glycine ligase